MLSTVDCASPSNPPHFSDGCATASAFAGPLVGRLSNSHQGTAASPSECLPRSFFFLIFPDDHFFFFSFRSSLASLHSCFSPTLQPSFSLALVSIFFTFTTSLHAALAHSPFHFTPVKSKTRPRTLAIHVDILDKHSCHTPGPCSDSVHLKLLALVRVALPTDIIITRRCSPV